MIYSGNENYAIEYYVKLVIKNKLGFFSKADKNVYAKRGTKKETQ